MVTTHFLFTTHRDGVFRYLCRIVGPIEAPDLTQEVFLRISQATVPDAPAEAQRAWVFRIARNLALNHRRDTQKRPTVGLVETPSPPSQETTAALHEALERLAPLDRDVFLLRETAGLSYGEIGLACDLSGAAVRSRLHRARQQLREQLAPLVRHDDMLSVRLYDKR